MSKTLISLVLVASLAAPAAVLAQDDAAAAAPAEEAAPAAADDASTDTGSTTDSSSTTVDSTVSTSGDGSSSDSSGSGSEDSSSSDSAAEEKLQFYGGLARVESKLNLSNNSLRERYGHRNFDGGFYLLHAGYRVAPGIAVEAQGGAFPDHANSGHGVNFDHFYAAYLVTTGTVIEALELSARVGYAFIGARNYTAKENFDTFSYGVEAALPLRVFSDTLPDIRFTLGGTVFTQQHSERSYGWLYGLRYDFGI